MQTAMYLVEHVDDLAAGQAEDLVGLLHEVDQFGVVHRRVLGETLQDRVTAQPGQGVYVLFAVVVVAQQGRQFLFLPGARLFLVEVHLPDEGVDVVLEGIVRGLSKAFAGRRLVA